METILATFDAMATGATTAMAALLLGALCGAGLWRLHAVLRGTTLVVPWCWAIAALAAVVGCETVLGFAAARFSPQGSEALRYAAACLSCCATVSVLGAKRPQHNVWQFVVLSLWAAAALPAAGALLAPAGAPIEIDLARAWLLAVVIAVGCANWLPTRYWLAAILAAAGQTVLLAEALPLSVPGLGSVGVLACLALWAAAALVAVLARPPRCEDGLDRLWRDFRDSFGVAWGLRVAERVNAAAAQHGWPIRLSWQGFRSEEDLPDENPRPKASPDTSVDTARNAVRRNLTGLLRRFVSERWIASRLDESID